MIPLETVDALDTLLGTAMRVVDELRGEGLLHRLVAVLGCMVPEDREDILGVLEHDAEAAAQLPAENLWSRYGARPNPFAQLFTRAYRHCHSPDARHLQVRRATILGARMARSVPVSTERAWEPETLEAWRSLSPERRVYVEDMSRRVLATLRPNRRRPSRV